MSRSALLSLLCGATATALAQPASYVLTVDTPASNVTVNVTALGFNDSDSTGISGSVSATVAPGSGAPAAIHLTVLVLDATETLSVNLGNVILGGVMANSPDFGLRMGNGYGAAGRPTAVGGGGAFTQAGNLVQTIGMLNYQGYGFLGGGFGSGSVDMSANDPSVADLGGTVTIGGGMITLTLPVNITQQIPFDGFTATVVATGTIVARAPLATVVTGDLTGDGCVNQSDLGTLLADFGCTAGLLLCPGDVTGDGETNQSDLGVLLANFGAGC